MYKRQELARTDATLRNLVTSDEDAYLKDILIAAQDVLREKGAPNAADLIDIEDPCWSQLSEAEVSGSITLLLNNPPDESLAYAQVLQTACTNQHRGLLGRPGRAHPTDGHPDKGRRRCVISNG